MNNNNAPALIRAFIIYAMCIPLAVWIGYMLAMPADRLTFSYGGILALLFLAPILLRWHHFLLIAGWNFGLTIFFLPGSPPIWLLLTALSFGISVLHRTVNSKAHFLSAPEIARPLLLFLGVAAVTAELTGGIGLHSFGNEVSGGKRYVTLFFGILGYFALTAMRIPPKRVGLYISLFFLGRCSAGIGDLAAYVPSKLYFLFAFFPASGYDMEGKPGVMNFHARFAGVGILGMSCFLFMLARYGVRGIFLSGRPWRCIAFGVFFILIFFGGFRSHVILCSFTFAVQFFMERMHRSHVMPVFIFIGVIAVTLLVPFANKLPFTFQRALAFLPLKLDKAPRMDAVASRDWRLEIWRDTYPKVPQYLLLGKGYAISREELEIATSQNFTYLSTADLVATAGNYHSGPLSVLMPFGAWGAIALFWFWFASLRALYANYRYGDPAFQTVNIFLFSYFAVRVFHFLVIFGGLETDLADFAALIGLSVSINGGIRRPAPVPVPMADRLGHPRWLSHAFNLFTSVKTHPAGNAPVSRVKPKLLIVELWGLGDLAIATPFLRVATEKYQVTLLAKPFARDLQPRLWPGVRVETFTAPWTAFQRKYHLWHWSWLEMERLRRRLKDIHFDLGLSARWDPRDHLLLLLAGTRERLGFARTQSEIFLTRPLVRPAPEAHHYEYWRVIAHELELELPPRNKIFTPVPRKLSTILIHTGAAQSVRVWPLKKYQTLAMRLRQKKFTVQIVCDPDQRAFWLEAGEMEVAAPANVTELIALIDQAEVFIGNDSGPGHLAGICGVPTFTLFGPQLPEWFAPLHPASEWLPGRACPYKPCSDYCRFPVPFCLQDIGEDETSARVEQFVAAQMSG